MNYISNINNQTDNRDIIKFYLAGITSAKGATLLEDLGLNKTNEINK